MRHVPHRQGVLVTALLAALLGSSVALAPTATATATAAAPKDRDTGTTKAKHGPKQKHERKHEQKQDKHEHGHAARHEQPAPSHPHRSKQQRRAAATPSPTTLPLPVAPAPVATVVLRSSRAALRPEPATASPFRRSSRPFRPLVRPSVVPASRTLWQVHEPADRPLVRALRTTAEHPTTPLLVAVLVGLFLLVQHRIDRGDPKLSRGHREDPPDLRFRPALRLQTAL